MTDKNKNMFSCNMTVNRLFEIICMKKENVSYQLTQFLTRLLY